MTYMATCPGVHEIYNLEPSLIIKTMCLVYLIYAQEQSRSYIFK